MSASLPDENWLPVKDYEGYYEVSDLGRVRSLPRTVAYVDGRVANMSGRVLKFGKAGRSEHRHVNLHRDGVGHKAPVHRLVLETFVGPCPPGMECLHWDDDGSNNHLSNLRWGTPSENSRDKVRNGRNPNALRTRCPQDHEYTAENTYVSKRGHRHCITCMREHTRQWRKRRFEQTMKELQWVS